MSDVWLRELRGLVQTHRKGAAAMSAIVCPLAAAASMVPFRDNLAGAAMALALVAIIFAIARWGNRAANLAAAFGAIIWFDFFLTKPYEQLTIGRPGHLETAVGLLVVGLVVSEHAVSARRHRRAAREDARNLAVLHQVAELVATGAPASLVVERVRSVMIALLGLQGCRFEPGPAGRRRAMMRGDGEIVYGTVLWGASTMGLPGRGVDLPIRCAGGLLGRFVLMPSPGRPITLERRIVAVALTDQVGSALAGGRRDTECDREDNGAGRFRGCDDCEAHRRPRPARARTNETVRQRQLVDAKLEHAPHSDSPGGPGSCREKGS
jgi:Domain of unknown function (DUF4118)